jgi:nitrile hydratase accessory protein
MRDTTAGEIPGIPRGPDGPVFHAPWEAQAFAIVLALHERGVFTWTEWATTLADEIKHAQTVGDPDTGDTYYRHWLTALERIVAEKGAADRSTLVRYRAAWQHAAQRTQHGRPIALLPEDFPDVEPNSALDSLTEASGPAAAPLPATEN